MLNNITICKKAKSLKKTNSLKHTTNQEVKPMSENKKFPELPYEKKRKLWKIHQEAKMREDEEEDVANEVKA